MSVEVLDWGSRLLIIPLIWDCGSGSMIHDSLHLFKGKLWAW